MDIEHLCIKVLLVSIVERYTSNVVNKPVIKKKKLFKVCNSNEERLAHPHIHECLLLPGDGFATVSRSDG